MSRSTFFRRAFSLLLAAGMALSGCATPTAEPAPGAESSEENAAVSPEELSATEPVEVSPQEPEPPLALTGDELLALMERKIPLSEFTLAEKDAISAHLEKLENIPLSDYTLLDLAALGWANSLRFQEQGEVQDSSFLEQDVQYRHIGLLPYTHAQKEFYYESHPLLPLEYSYYYKLTEYNGPIDHFRGPYSMVTSAAIAGLEPGESFDSIQEKWGPGEVYSSSSPYRMERIYILEISAQGPMEYTFYGLGEPVYHEVYMRRTFPIEDNWKPVEIQWQTPEDPRYARLVDLPLEDCTAADLRLLLETQPETLRELFGEHISFHEVGAAYARPFFYGQMSLTPLRGASIYANVTLPQEDNYNGYPLLQVSGGSLLGLPLSDSMQDVLDAWGQPTALYKGAYNQDTDTDYPRSLYQYSREGLEIFFFCSEHLPNGAGIIEMIFVGLPGTAIYQDPVLQTPPVFPGLSAAETNRIGQDRQYPLNTTPMDYNNVTYYEQAGSTGEDEAHLYYLKKWRDLPQSQLYRIDKQTGEAAVLATRAEAFVPRSGRVYYSLPGSGQQHQVYAISREGGNAELLFTAEGKSIQLDIWGGKLYAYLDDRTMVVHDLSGGVHYTVQWQGHEDIQLKNMSLAGGYAYFLGTRYSYLRISLSTWEEEWLLGADPEDDEAPAWPMYTATLRGNTVYYIGQKAEDPFGGSWASAPVGTVLSADSIPSPNRYLYHTIMGDYLFSQTGTSMSWPTAVQCFALPMSNLNTEPLRAVEYSGLPRSSADSWLITNQWAYSLEEPGRRVRLLSLLRGDWPFIGGANPPGPGGAAYGEDSEKEASSEDATGNTEQP